MHRDTLLDSNFQSTHSTYNSVSVGGLKEDISVYILYIYTYRVSKRWWSRIILLNRNRFADCSKCIKYTTKAM